VHLRLNPARWLRAPGDVLLLPWAADDGTQAGNIWNDGTQAGNITMAPDDPGARRLDGLIRSGAPLTAALRAAGVGFV
jgi:hypothetical protein